MTRKTRPISWLRAALREFETFPAEAQSICLAALTIAAEGGKADIAKPLHGMGSGVFEIALPFEAMRTGWFTPCSLGRKSGRYTRFRRNQRGESKLRNARSI